MKIEIFSLYVGFLLCTYFSSADSVISEELQTELRRYLTYNPCYRFGSNRNNRDCKKAVTKFQKIPSGERGACAKISSQICSGKWTEYCKVWIKQPGGAEAKVKLSWCINQAGIQLPPKPLKKSSSLRKLLSFRSQSKKGGST